MDNTPKQMTRVQAIRDFFYRPGVDTLQSFMAELKALTNEDKDELVKLIVEKTGVVIKD
jgi:hypothetical protein